MPFLLSLMLLGYFERVREFIRKPYVIPGYMYSNTFRVEDYPLLRRDGVLAHSTYGVPRGFTPDLKVAAGRDVFALTCTRCHTTAGVNGVVAKFERLLGRGSWDEAAIANYVGNMHGARPFMPPFPGSDAELSALAAYVAQLRANPEPGLGAQSAGVAIAPSRVKGPEVQTVQR
jgi:cytochrome c553